MKTVFSKSKDFGRIAALLCVLTFLGCTKESKPAGMPDLYPLKVKIVQGGAPLADAQVSFVSTDPGGGKWPSGGRTDANGELEMMTYGQYKGVPLGNFKVTVSKVETKFDTGDPPNVIEEHNLVDKKYSQSGSSDLTFEMKPEITTAEFDVGAAVRDLIPRAPGS